MDDKDFIRQMRYALDEPDSRFCIFMKRVAGYRFFEIGNPICIPKFILFERLKCHPHMLELLEQGNHPDYKRVYKENFDTIQEEIWNTQSGSQPTTDPTS